MTDVKWIKLTIDIFDDEKIKLIDAMPEKDALFVIWIKLLVLAGKVNDNGVIYLSEHVPYTCEMLSTIFNRPLSVVELALSVLQRLGMIEILEDQRIQIVNWDKHQFAEGLAKIREQTRKRVAAFRERKKEEELYIDSNVSVTLPKKQSYAEHVCMTEYEYQKLITKYGKDTTAKFIEKLDNAKGAKGYKYKNDYRAILTWVVEAIGARPLPGSGFKKCPKCGDAMIGKACACGWGVK